MQVFIGGMSDGGNRMQVIQGGSHVNRNEYNVWFGRVNTQESCAICWCHCLVGGFLWLLFTAVSPSNTVNQDIWQNMIKGITKQHTVLLALLAGWSGCLYGSSWHDKVNTERLGDTASRVCLTGHSHQCDNYHIGHYVPHPDFNIDHQCAKRVCYPLSNLDRFTFWIQHVDICMSKSNKEMIRAICKLYFCFARI